jgi:hypothetical protein
MPTTKHDIQIQKGANFRLNVQARNSDRSVKTLVGYQARLKVRKNYGDIDPPLASGTTEDGVITINGPGGVIMINIPASTTLAYTWTSGVWDLEVYTSVTDVDRIVEGFASLSPEVTT